MTSPSFAKAPRLSIDDILLDESIHIIVCTGAGGVGKTTIATNIVQALGLWLLSLTSPLLVLFMKPQDVSPATQATSHLNSVGV